MDKTKFCEKGSDCKLNIKLDPQQETVILLETIDRLCHSSFNIVNDPNAVTQEDIKKIE